MTSASGLGGQLGNLADHKLVDAIRLVDLVETIGGKHNRVSLEHQAWRPMITTPLIEGEVQFNFLAGGSVLRSKGGSLLASAEAPVPGWLPLGLKKQRGNDPFSVVTPAVTPSPF